MKKTQQEWRKIVTLTNFASLSNNKGSECSEVEKLREILKKEHGLTEEDLRKELNRFKKEVAPQKEVIIKQKVDKIMREIVKGLKKLEKGESLSTSDNVEIYYMMQEILAIDYIITNQIFQEEEEKANVSHTIIYATDLKGNDLGGHTYYFSFDK